jgi:hypothetical protein
MMRGTSYTDLGARARRLSPGEHPVVEDFEVVWPQASRAGGADGREDVALGVVDAAAAGAGGQRELLARQTTAVSGTPRS